MSAHVTGAMSDDELAVLLKQSDREAFTVIYDRYFWLLHVHAYKWLRKPEETDDIIHELFLTLWEKREQLDLEGRLAPYLYASVRNRVFRFLQRSRYAVQYVEELEDFLKTGECLTDHRLREKMLIAVIEAGIAEMPKKMREVFELSRKGQLSHKEIAEQLDISEETVRKHVHHALKILRPKLQLVILASLLLK